MVASLLLASACSTVPPLQNTHPSAESLASAVLDAVARQDGDALGRLAVSEQEFRDHVWPDLPAARPERNLPFSYVWGDLRQKSEQSLRIRLTEHGGRRYTLESVRFDGDTTQYEHYLVHRDTVLTVRDHEGTTSEIRLFGSALEKDGWKVFSYVVD